jgi:hypothetical protein
MKCSNPQIQIKVDVSCSFQDRNLRWTWNSSGLDADTYLCTFFCDIESSDFREGEVPRLLLVRGVGSIWIWKQTVPNNSLHFST